MTFGGLKVAVTNSTVYAHKVSIIIKASCVVVTVSGTIPLPQSTSDLYGTKMPSNLSLHRIKLNGKMCRQCKEADNLPWRLLTTAFMYIYMEIMAGLDKMYIRGWFEVQVRYHTAAVMYENVGFLNGFVLVSDYFLLPETLHL